MIKNGVIEIDLEMGIMMKVEKIETPMIRSTKRDQSSMINLEQTAMDNEPKVKVAQDYLKVKVQDLHVRRVCVVVELIQ